MNDTVNLTPTTPEELLDSAWARLLEFGPASDDPDLSTLISRDQLAGFMAEAALMAIGAANMDAPVEGARPVPALLQSLKVMGDLRGNVDGNKGHQAICQGAITFIERVCNDVTRLLIHPGFLVTHATVDGDLSVASVRFAEDGSAWCQCVPAAYDGAPAQWQFRLSELAPAGPVSDAARIIVAGLTQALVEDTVAKIVGGGYLHRLGEEVPGLEPVAWLRDVDGDHLNLCGKGDPGAFPVYGNPDGELATGGVVEHVPTVVGEQPGESLIVDSHDMNHCDGCDIPEADRVNLPDQWQPGDAIPEGLTVHTSSRDGQAFAFVGDPLAQKRQPMGTAYIRDPANPEAPPTVHHLTPHPEYVMGPDGVHAEPVDPDDVCPLCGVSRGCHAADCPNVAHAEPLDQHPTCDQCNQPLHKCTCVPMDD